MENKHTPGPWKCYPVSSKVSYNNRTFEIHGFETDQYVRDVLPTEVAANAQLIASAPELLEALKTIQRYAPIIRDLVGEVGGRTPTANKLHEIADMIYNVPLSAIAKAEAK